MSTSIHSQSTPHRAGYAGNKLKAAESFFQTEAKKPVETYPRTYFHSSGGIHVLYLREAALQVDSRSPTATIPHQKIGSTPQNKVGMMIFVQHLDGGL